MTNHATRVLRFAVTGALLVGGAGCPGKSGPYTNTGRMTPPDDGDDATAEGGETPPVEPPVVDPPTEPAPDPAVADPSTMNMRKVEDPATPPKR